MLVAPPLMFLSAAHALRRCVPRRCCWRLRVRRRRGRRRVQRPAHRPPHLSGLLPVERRVAAVREAVQIPESQSGEAGLDCQLVLGQQGGGVVKPHLVF